MRRLPVLTPFVRDRLIFVALVTAALAVPVFWFTRQWTPTLIVAGGCIGFWSLVALSHWSSSSHSPWAAFAMGTVLAAICVALIYIGFEGAAWRYMALALVAFGAARQFWVGVARLRMAHGPTL